MIDKFALITFLFLCPFFIGADDGFGDIFGDAPLAEESSKLPISVSGEIGMSMDYYLNDGLDSTIEAIATADIALEVATDSVEAKVAFTFSADDLDSLLTFDDLIDELYVKAFFPFGYLDGGYIKTEWGKGDGDHVLDPLNPLDQSNGLFLDLNKMKSSEILARLNLYLGGQGLLELVYKPFYTPVSFSTEGRWSVFDISTLPDYQNIVDPDTKTLKYSQAAARATGSFGAFDLGMMYYWGFMTEPGYKITLSTDIVYTRAHLLGVEGAFPLGPFTLRTELGYWITEDMKGDAPEYYNNRFVYLAGFDVTIPGTSLFVSAQAKGSYVLKYDDQNPTDVDVMASYDSTAFSNTVMVTVELPFYREKMKLRLTGLLQIESLGYMIAPSYFWKIKDDLELSLNAKIFGGKDSGLSPYKLWDNNDSISLSMSYKF